MKYLAFVSFLLILVSCANKEEENDYRTDSDINKSSQVQQINKNCDESGHQNLSISQGSYINTPNARTFGDTVVAIYCPQQWRLASSEKDTVNIHIQLPKNTQVIGVKKSTIVSGSNCDNDYLVFDFDLDTDQNKPKRIFSFDYLIAKSEWIILERCMVKIKGKKKTTVAANSDVDPSE